MNAETPNTHGGKRANAGRRIELPGETAEKHTVTLDAMTVRKAKVLGDGNLSLGLRKGIGVAYARYQATA